MRGVKLDQETIGLAALLERRTHAIVKSCIKEEDTLYFIVGSGQIGKALGKGAIHAKKLSQETGKKVRIIEYNDDAAIFVKNVIFPTKVDEISLEENTVVIRDPDRRKKGILFGRDRSNLVLINKLVRQFFNVEVKIE